MRVSSLTDLILQNYFALSKSKTIKKKQSFLRVSTLIKDMINYSIFALILMGFGHSKNKEKYNYSIL
jgi:hypothetical protein